jgi:hypothetical protein
MSVLTDPAEVLAALAAPFDRAEVKFRPGAVSGNRALALPYIDARAVQDRLDTVVGAANWTDAYEFLPDGSALCRLQLRIGAEWIAKADVGGPSEQPDEGDRHKAAVSDALKRAAVKWGVGRYLYRVPQQWCDFDPGKKRFVKQPELSAPVLAATNGKAAHRGPVAQQKTADRPVPKTPAELADRMHEFGAALVKSGLCERVDELLDFIRGALGTDGALLHQSPDRWPTHLIGQAMREARAFESLRRKRAQLNCEEEQAATSLRPQGSRIAAPGVGQIGASVPGRRPRCSEPEPLP